MFTKLICALLISTMLFSCDKNANKKTPISDIELSPVGKSSPPEILNEPEQQIPVTNMQTLADTITEPAPQSHPQPNTKTPVKETFNNDWNKKIIKTATLRLEAKNFKGYNELLTNKIKQYGGYIAQEDNNLTDEKSETVIAIKVPVQLFDGLLNDLTNADVKILEKSIKSEDVTGDVVDTRSRLEAKKQMRLKYLDFLKESKNMSEVLQVQNEINNIQEEIESASGRFTSLSMQAAYSTINLTFFQPATGYKPADENPSFFSKTAYAFKQGASWLSNLFLALISIWPLLAGCAVIIFIYKKNRRTKVVQQNA